MRIEYIRFLNKKPRKAKHCYIKNRDKIINNKLVKDCERNSNRSYVENCERNSNRSYVKNCDKSRNCEKEFKEKWKLKKIAFNKNRVALVAISLMLVTASYWNYLNKTKLKIAQLGDATFVNSNAVVGENEESENGESKEVATQDVTQQDTAAQNEISQQENGTNATSQQKTGSKDVTSKQETETQEVISQQKAGGKDVTAQQEVANSADEQVNSNYFTKIKLDREKMFSQMIDNYKSILENSSIADEQKKVASDEIKNINNNQNSITTIENLLKGKGFKDVVVLLNNNSTNVIVKSDDELKKEQVAQIENIVSRELNIEIEKIHITTHK